MPILDLFFSFNMQFSLKSLALLALALAVSAQDVSTPPDQQAPPSDTGSQVPNSSQPPATDSASAPAASSPAASSQPPSVSASAPVSSSASATSSSATPTGSSLGDCLSADPYSTTDYFASIKYSEPLRKYRGADVCRWVNVVLTLCVCGWVSIL